MSLDIRSCYGWWQRIASQQGRFGVILEIFYAGSTGVGLRVGITFFFFFNVVLAGESGERIKSAVMI
jgi:hypothetical protein